MMTKLVFFFNYIFLLFCRLFFPHLLPEISINAAGMLRKVLGACFISVSSPISTKKLFQIQKG